MSSRVCVDMFTFRSFVVTLRWRFSGIIASAFAIILEAASSVLYSDILPDTSWVLLQLHTQQHQPWVLYPVCLLLQSLASQSPLVCLSVLISLALTAPTWASAAATFIFTNLSNCLAPSLSDLKSSRHSVMLLAPHSDGAVLQIRATVEFSDIDFMWSSTYRGSFCFLDFI